MLCIVAQSYHLYVSILFFCCAITFFFLFFYCDLCCGPLTLVLSLSTPSLSPHACNKCNNKCKSSTLTCFGSHPDFSFWIDVKAGIVLKNSQRFRRFFVVLPHNNQSVFIPAIFLKIPVSLHFFAQPRRFAFESHLSLCHLIDKDGRDLVTPTLSSLGSLFL